MVFLGPNVEDFLKSFVNIFEFFSTEIRRVVLDSEAGLMRAKETVMTEKM